MDFVLCRKCDTGNPGYLSVCGNCGADLFAREDPTPSVAPEINQETLRRNLKISVAVSLVTTIAKIVLLYTIVGNARRFPTLTDIAWIVTPYIAAAFTMMKIKRWYRVLIADSIVVIIAFLLFIAELILAKLNGY